MKNLLTALIFSGFCLSFLACTNEADRTGVVDDTTRVNAPTEKVQDSTSLTDTSYRIGDPVH